MTQLDTPDLLSLVETTNGTRSARTRRTELDARRKTSLACGLWSTRPSRATRASSATSRKRRLLGRPNGRTSRRPTSRPRPGPRLSAKKRKRKPRRHRLRRKPKRR